MCYSPITPEPSLAPCLDCLENVLTPPTPPDLAEKLQPGFFGVHLFEIQKQKIKGREKQEQFPALLPWWVLENPQLNFGA